MFNKLRKKMSGWFSKAKVEEEKEGKEREKTITAGKSKIVEKREDGRKSDQDRLFDRPGVVGRKKEALEAHDGAGEREEKGFFSKLKEKLASKILKREEFDEMFEEFEMTLLESNVALVVVDKIREDLAKDLVGVPVKKGGVERTIVESLKDSVLDVLFEGGDLIKEIEKAEGQYVILFFGINGSGKTTSVAKLASMLKKKGVSCVLGAGDTFRAASIEQLEKHAEKIGVPIVKSAYGADPASVAFEAVSYAKKNKIKAVLIDTAGRMYTKANLMKEMEKIVRVAKPNLKIFVGESITGNDATEQARIFNDSVGIDGIILTKADVDEKAGTILSVGYVTKKPIYFLGVGQKYEDLKEFRKEDVLKGLGLG